MEQLNNDICYQALKTRDRRFDGRFYTAVLTTGIFCRPICPAVTPKRANVEFYPSAEAAIAHGFRPCLRCRPEAAPGSPASAGVHATVARAVRLIDQGVLETGSIADLADRLGVGDRHLRRIFKEHTGVTPQEHAKARRLLRARQLIVDSNLTMIEIADIAGFGSLRRFNDAMKQAYRQAPTAFRRGIKLKSSQARSGNRGDDDPFAPRNDDLILRLRARQPFDAEYLLAFFRARAIPGLEAVRDRIYARGFAMGDQVGLMICHFSPDQSGVDVILRGPAREAVLEIGARVRRLFDLDADVPSITAQFAEDMLLAPLIEKRPGLRVPGCWDRFELAMRAVLGQQVSVAAARTLAGRLVARFGAELPGDLVAGTGVTHLFPDAPQLVGQELISIGLTTRRAQTLADVIELFADRASDQKSGETLIADLTGIKGIGPWTLNYFGLRGLGDPDAFPAADLGILKASAMGGGPDKAKALDALSESWRPWRAYAAQYLWSALEGEG
ncbi:DNA-3-methyladenine glycosylase 2 family protein [Thalassospira sp. GO-4]|jgi:AraC family transcriptional regulator of adaptative response / DNA-3-methyladenine glycosylase II|uniref:DNA-3-methyladenine glycosylase 2 family protein n=1 Tax=Thalassospira sp. GO-4 TaxID=2946605 RepID=UPI0020257896|nr:DNA-3-methyladenine glycosylase 2 family protein [Thalassospira sp. GO-4]URK19114.1 DNA-3-methyladenine glycosylase 2 family protein [Thalassospira sp. GO-4]